MSEEILFTTPPLKKTWPMAGGPPPQPDDVTLSFYGALTIFKKHLGAFTQAIPPDEAGKYIVTITGDDGATKSFSMGSFETMPTMQVVIIKLNLQNDPLGLGMPRNDNNPGTPPETGPFKDSTMLSVTLKRKVGAAAAAPLSEITPSAQPAQFSPLMPLMPLMAETTSPSVVIPTLYFDLSCWADNSSAPAISGGSIGNATNVYTVDKCYQRALTKGHDLFALQGGNKCFTGRLSVDNYKIYGAVTTPSLCTATGGTLVNHVYSVNSLSFIAPHETIDYSTRSSAPALYSDFVDQTSGLMNSLSNVPMSNPAPFMTAMDADINSLRDSVTIQKLKDENSQTIVDASRMFEEAMDMSGVIQSTQTDMENLRREVMFSFDQKSVYKGFLLPLQILAGTLILAVIVGSLLPAGPGSSGFVLAILVAGFGATLYFALNKESPQ